MPSLPWRMRLTRATPSLSKARKGVEELLLLTGGGGDAIGIFQEDLLGGLGAALRVGKGKCPCCRGWP
jgi:hypothetical protein